MKTTRSKRMLALLMAGLLMINNLSSLQTYASAGEEQIPAVEETVQETPAPAPAAEPVVETPAAEPAVSAPETVEEKEVEVPAENVQVPGEKLTNAGEPEEIPDGQIEKYNPWEVTFLWKGDSEVKNATRPNEAYYKDFFKLWRIVEGQSMNDAVEVPVDTISVSISENPGEGYTKHGLMIHNLPKTDNHGNAYTYFLKPVNPEISRDTSSKGGHYNVETVRNGQTVDAEYYLFKEVISFTLEPDPIEYYEDWKATVVWRDDMNSRYTRPSEGPDGLFQLYRYEEGHDPSTAQLQGPSKIVDEGTATDPVTGGEVSYVILSGDDLVKSKHGVNYVYFLKIPEGELSSNTSENGGEYVTDHEGMMINEGDECMFTLIPYDVDVYEITENTGSSTVIKWNDNRDEKGQNPNSHVMEPRPTADAYKADNLVLQVKVIKADGDETFDDVQWITVTADDEELLEKLGLTEVPQPTIDDQDTQWKITYTNNLPSKIVETIKKYDQTTGVLIEDETIEYTAIYRVMEKDDQVNGYLPADYTYQNEESDIPNVILNTARQDFDAKIYWYDNQNAYGTRPDKGKFRLFRYLNGEEMDKAEDVTDDYPVDFTETDLEKGTLWEYTSTGIPAFDEEGNPYIYFLKIVDDDDELSENEEAGTYEIEYRNEDNFSNVDGQIMIDGEMHATIVNETDFSVTKIWEDEGKDPTTRPKFRLYLSRIAEGPDGKVDTDKLANAGAVDGHDFKDVPRTDAEAGAEYVVENNDGKDMYLIEFTPGEDTLPMYDTEGRKYVYYVQEIGDAGEYITRIDNSATDVNQYAKDQFEGTKYILNKGVITNDRDQVFNMPATKQFNAAALQSMEGTVVTYKLETRKEGETAWKDADPSLIPKSDQETEGLTLVEGTEDPTTGEVSGGKVLFEISGFTNEEMTQTRSLPVYRYVPETGAKIEYRWVEVSMDVNGSGEKTVPEYRNGESVDVNMGEVLPGVGADKTTAIIVPNQVNDTTIVNSLHAETQIQVTKTWGDPDDGHALTTNEEIIAAYGDVTLTFTITRNDGVSSADGKLKDAFGNTVQNLVLTSANYDEAVKAWIGSINDLERFNPVTGEEYTYKLNETGDWKALYHHEYVVTGDDDDANIKVTQQNAFFHNGPPEGLVIGVEKVYLDGSDLISRQPVTVGIFRKDNGQLVKSTVLNERNGWWELIGFEDVIGNGKVTDYVAKEIAVGEQPVVYFPNMTNDAIYNQAAAFPGYGSYSNAVGSVIGEKDDLYYNYNVYIKSNNDGAVYTVYNQRIGVQEIDLKKHWVAGSHDGLGAVFRVLRNGQPYVLKSGDVKLGSGADSGTKFHVNNDGTVTVSSPNADGKYTVAIDIVNLPKYDAEGVQYTYTLEEVKVLDVGTGVESVVLNDASTYPSYNVNHNNNTVVINNDSFSVSLAETKRDIKTKDEHHTGDVYVLEAGNTLGGTYHLSANKVWRDDADGLRPDVTFDVYAVNEKDLPILTSMLDNPGQFPADSLAAVVAGKGKIVSGRRLWDTTHNNWFWSVDLGDYPKYNADGYRYVYYLTENYESYQGLYELGYYNGTVKPQDGAKESTEQVFGVTKDNFVTSVCLLADGVHSDDGADSYSKTTVNYRVDTRTISGRKIWKVPDGWSFSNKELPTVQIDLYRTLDKTFASDYTGKVAADFIKEHPDKADKVGEFVLNPDESGNYNFQTDVDMDGNALVRFDDFGRRYNYFLVENQDSYKLYNYDPASVRINAYTFNIENNYTFTDEYVKVKVNKAWAHGSNVDKDPSAYFRVTLYGKTGTNTITMGYAILRPDDEEVTFEYYTGTAVDVNGTSFNPASYANKKLPYYGPDGKPIVYYLMESSVNGYITEMTSQVGNSVDKPVVLTYDAATKTHSGEISFKNTYDGDKVDLTIQKLWGNETVYVGNSPTSVSNTAYRPDSITVDVARKWSNATIEGITFPGGDERVVINEQQLQLVLNKNQNPAYKDTIHDLPRYAPNGKPYTYYVIAEDGTAVTDKAHLYYYDVKVTGTGTNVKIDNTTSFTNNGTVENDSFTNNLKVVSVSGSKSWAYRVGNSTTPTAMTATVWKNLKTLGALPQSVTLAVQRSENGTKWEYIPNPGTGNFAVSIDGETGKVLGQTFTIGNSIPTISATFSRLPKYVNDGGTTEYQYRVVEVLNWGNNIPQSIYVGSGNNLLTYTGSKFDPEEASLSVTGTTYAYTNTIPLVSLKLQKEWIDGSNEYGTRPSSITAQVKINSGAMVTCTIDRTVTGSTTETEGSILLPAPAGDNTADAMNILYVDVIEQAIKNYIENEIDENTISGPDANGEFGYRLQNELRLSEVYATKSWTKNGTGSVDAANIAKMVAAGTLPDSLKFVLYSWVEGTEKSTATVVTDSTGANVEATIALTTLASGKQKIFGTDNGRALPLYTADKVKINYELREVSAFFGTKEITINEDGIYPGIDSLFRDEFSSSTTGSTTVSVNVSGTFTNDVETTEVSATKKWTDDEGNTIDWATFQNLRTLGALPKSISFVLQVAEVGRDVWSDAKTLGQGAVYVDGTKIDDATTLVSGLTADTYNALSAEFNDLPKSQVINGTVYNYQYRVKEKLTWNDNTTSEYYAGAASDQLAPADSTIAPETASVEVNSTTGAHAFTNAIPLLKIKLKKTWVDNSNEDNLRLNGDLSVTITQNVDNGAAVQCTIGKPETDADEWESGIYLLPMPKDVTDAASVAAYLNSAYVVAEAAINNYVLTHEDEFAVNSDGVYEYGFTNEERFSKIVVKKTWEDGEGELDTEALDELIEQKMIPDSIKFQLMKFETNAAANTDEYLAAMAAATAVTDNVQTLGVHELAVAGATGIEWGQDLPVWTTGETPVRIHYIAQEIAYVYGDTEYALADVAGIDGGIDEVNEAGIVFTEISFLNTIETTGVSASKTWKNSATDDDLDSATYQRLVAMGVMPSAFTFVLQRSEDGGTTYDDITAVNGTDLNGNALQNVTYELTADADYNGMTASWNNLPMSSNGTSGTKNYTYRVIERLTWAGTTVPSNYDGTGSNKLAPANSEYAPIEAELAEVVDDAYAFTNTIGLLTIELKKVWIDGEGADELRPEDLDATIIKKVGEQVVVTGTLKPVTGSDDWEADTYFYLPTPAGQAKDDYTSDLNSIYKALEAEIDEYVQVNADTFVKNSDVYTYTFENEQRISTIDIVKSWTDSEGNELDKDALEALIDQKLVPDALKFQLFSYVGDAEPEAYQINGADATVTFDVLDLADEAQTWDVSLPAWTRDGDQIHYTVEEIAYVFGDTVTPVDDLEGITCEPVDVTPDKTSYEVSFTNELEDTSVSASKIWNNSWTNRPMDYETFTNLITMGVLPEKITLVVQRRANGDTWEDIEDLDGRFINDETVENAEMVLADADEDEFNSFAAEWTGLPVSANEDGVSVNYEYRVVEQLTWADGSETRFGDGSAKNQAPEGYAYAPISSALAKPQDNAYDYTNTVRLLAIELRKQWDDNEDEDGLRPEEIGTKIQVNDNVSIVGTLTEADDWAYGYYLPVPNITGTSDYSEYLNRTYGVFEDLDSATDELETVLANYVQTFAGEFTLTDGGIYAYTFVNEEQVTEVTLDKSWITSEENDLSDDEIKELVELGVLPASITFELYKWIEGDEENAEKAGLTKTYTYEELFTTQTIDVLDNNLMLPVWDADGNRIEYAMKETVLNYADDHKVPVDDDAGVNVDDESTATSYEDGSLATEITNELVTAHIKVQKEWIDDDLYGIINAVDCGVRPVSIDINLYRDGEKYGETVTIDNETGWAHTWDNLPVYQAGSKELSVWTVEEVIDDVHKTYYPTVIYTPAFAENVGSDETIVEPGEDNDAVADGGEAGGDGSEAGGDGTDASEDSAVTLTDGETYEIGIENIWETMHVYGHKIWNDDDDRDGLRPASITITLMGDEFVDEYPEYEITTIDVTEEDDWAWDFGDLPKYGMDGHKIGYSVHETIVYEDPEQNVDEGMMFKATADPGEGDPTNPEEEEPANDPYTINIIAPVVDEENNEVIVDVENIHVPETREIGVIKVWDDKSNKDGSRPKSVTIKLLANGKDTGKRLVLNKKNNWTGYFTDLYKYENHGTLIEYTIAEEKVSGYKCKIIGDMDTGFTVTNSHTPNPKTVDNSNLNLWLLICAIAMATMMAIIGRRLRCNR